MIVTLKAGGKEKSSYFKTMLTLSKANSDMEMKLLLMAIFFFFLIAHGPFKMMSLPSFLTNEYFHHSNYVRAKINHIKSRGNSSRQKEKAHMSQTAAGNVAVRALLTQSPTSTQLEASFSGKITVPPSVLGGHTLISKRQSNL